MLFDCYLSPRIFGVKGFLDPCLCFPREAEGEGERKRMLVNVRSHFLRRQKVKNKKKKKRASKRIAV